MSLTASLDKLERIDVHAHAITPRYREFLIQTGHNNPDGWPEIPVSLKSHSLCYKGYPMLTSPRKGGRLMWGQVEGTFRRQIPDDAMIILDCCRAGAAAVESQWFHLEQDGTHVD